MNAVSMFHRALVHVQASCLQQALVKFYCNFQKDVQRKLHETLAKLRFQKVQAKTAADVINQKLQTLHQKHSLQALNWVLMCLSKPLHCVLVNWRQAHHQACVAMLKQQLAQRETETQQLKLAMQDQHLARQHHCMQVFINWHSRVLHDKAKCCLQSWRMLWMSSQLKDAFDGNAAKLKKQSLVMLQKIMCQMMWNAAASQFHYLQTHFMQETLENKHRIEQKQKTVLHEAQQQDMMTAHLQQQQELITAHETQHQEMMAVLHMEMTVNSEQQEKLKVEHMQCTEALEIQHMTQQETAAVQHREKTCLLCMRLILHCWKSMSKDCVKATIDHWQQNHKKCNARFARISNLRRVVSNTLSMYTRTLVKNWQKNESNKKRRDDQRCKEEAANCLKLCEEEAAGHQKQCDSLLAQIHILRRTLREHQEGVLVQRVSPCKVRETAMIRVARLSNHADVRYSTLSNAEQRSRLQFQLSALMKQKPPPPDKESQVWAEAALAMDVEISHIEETKVNHSTEHLPADLAALEAWVTAKDH